MTLLFDENLSHHLVELLADCYPESTHVRDVGLGRADDEVLDLDGFPAHGRERPIVVMSEGNGTGKARAE